MKNEKTTIKVYDLPMRTENEGFDEEGDVKLLKATLDTTLRRRAGVLARRRTNSSTLPENNSRKQKENKKLIIGKAPPVRL